MDKRFGLKTHCIKDIINALKLQPEVEEALIFGSRAMGTYKNGSDIDIAIKGDKISFDTLSTLRLRLDELPYLYMYDVIDYKKISNPAVTAHIDELGIIFYKKEQQPSDWKTYTLGKNVVSKLGDGLHGTPIYDDNGEYYFINGSNLVAGKIVINSNTKKVSEEEFIKYKKELSERTILLGINGTIGNVALYNNEKCILGKSAAYLNINDDFDKNFVRYVLTNEHFQNYIKNNASGTTIKNVGLGLLRKYEFLAPEDKTEQFKIAQILSSLDDKIELNLQMNQTLEAMAQALFKEWFVDFKFPEFDGKLVDGLPKGWKKTTLKELVVVKNGYAFKGTDFIDDGVPVIKIKNVKPNKIILNTLSYVSRDVADKAQRYRINQDDILITMSGNRIDGTPDTWVGKVALFYRDGEFLLNQRVSILNIKDPQNTSKYYLTQLLSSTDFQYYFISNATSSGGQANISPDLIYKTEITFPSKSVLELYNDVIGVLFNKIYSNDSEIEFLTQTRDALLPKLMSGQIEIV